MAFVHEHINLQIGTLLILFFFLMPNNSLSAQDSSVKEEPIKDTIFSEYIIDQKNRFNVKLEVSNDISSYTLLEDGVELDLKPNLNLRYAAVFSYKFLSVRIGIRPKISDEEKEKKGGSDTFRLRLQLLFDKWNHVWQYNIDKGYYVTNTNDFVLSDDGVKIQFPQMSSNVFFGSTFYKFNKNYSIRASNSQTEIQSKSAGSFAPGISYNIYGLTGTKVVRNIDGERVERENYSEYSGASFALQLGYYYTFVLKKYWFINAFAVPNAGIDFYTTKITSSEGTTKRSFNDSYLALNYGFGGGFNGDKIFFGAQFKNRITNEKFGSNKLKITPSQNQFSVYFGYRFKAPKTISKPVDLIEEKVPILKDDNHR